MITQSIPSTIQTLSHHMKLWMGKFFPPIQFSKRGDKNAR